MQMAVLRLNGESEHTDDAVQVFVFPSDGAAACRRTKRGVKTQNYEHIIIHSVCVELQIPSVVVSQKQEEADCSPAPFFCMMMQVTGGERKHMVSW